MNTVGEHKVILNLGQLGPGAVPQEGTDLRRALLAAPVLSQT